MADDIYGPPLPDPDPAPRDQLFGGPVIRGITPKERLERWLNGYRYEEEPSLLSVLAAMIPGLTSMASPPSAATAGIPLVKLPVEKLEQMLANHKIQNMAMKSPSRIIRTIVPFAPEIEGSGMSAHILSGQAPFDPARHSREWAPWPEMEAVMPHNVRPWEKRLAQSELYRLSQQVLDELDVPANSAVEAYRGGKLMNPPQLPVSASPGEGVAEFFRWLNNGEIMRSEVPRLKIAALPDILSHQAGVDRGEMMIPSSVFRRHATTPIPKETQRLVHRSMDAQRQGRLVELPDDVPRSMLMRLMQLIGER